MLEMSQQYIFLSVDKQNSLSTKMIQADVCRVPARRSFGNHKDKFKAMVWKFLHYSQASFEVGIQLY